MHLQHRCAITHLLTSRIEFDTSKVYPVITKLSSSGKIKENIIAKENIGNNGLGVVNDKLIVGLQAGNHATLGVFNKQTLQKYQKRARRLVGQSGLISEYCGQNEPAVRSFEPLFVDNLTFMVTRRYGIMNAIR